MAYLWYLWRRTDVRTYVDIEDTDMLNLNTRFHVEDTPEKFYTNPVQLVQNYLQEKDTKENLVV